MNIYLNIMMRNMWPVHGECWLDDKLIHSSNFGESKSLQNTLTERICSKRKCPKCIYWKVYYSGSVTLKFKYFECIGFTKMNTSIKGKSWYGKSLIFSHFYKLEFPYWIKLYIHECHSCVVNNMKNKIKWEGITGIEFTAK